MFPLRVHRCPPRGAQVDILTVNQGTSLEHGTLFALLFFVIAPGVALLLMWRGITRAFRDAHRRRRIIVLTLAALALWVVASDFMLDIIFKQRGGSRIRDHFRPGSFPRAGLFMQSWPRIQP